MDKTIETTAEFALIESIAATLRAELGSEIEEQPAFRDPAEAGQVNRAYRAATSVILRKVLLPGENLASLLSRVLVRLARRRLDALGLSDADAELLIQVEGRDDWLAFLILTTEAEIAHVLRSEQPDSA
jgi:hypothetical protein